MKRDSYFFWRTQGDGNGETAHGELAAWGASSMELDGSYWWGWEG